MRRTRLLWLAAGLVVLFEAVSAGLVLQPRVDDTYRAYFIDKTSDCWPHATPAAYTLGETLSFVDGKGKRFDANKICGWFYPNEHGTWSYGAYSLLRFKFQPSGGPLLLTLAAGAMVNDDDPVQQVIVSAGGQSLATLVFDTREAQVKTVAIPADIAATSGDGLEVRFTYPNARPGDELGPNEDSHLRAIRMVALTLSPAPDLQS